MLRRLAVAIVEVEIESDPLALIARQKALILSRGLPLAIFSKIEAYRVRSFRALILEKINVIFSYNLAVFT